MVDFKANLFFPKVYWDMGVPNAQLPDQWPAAYSTKYNANNTLSVQFDDEYKVDTYLSVGISKFNGEEY